MTMGKILVVDDDPSLLELIRMSLEAASYEVHTAGRREDASESVRGRAFDLALVDLQLDHGDGISLMEEFHQSLPAMPVIILTAYGTIESAVDAMKRGAFGYLTKPFDPRELLLQIERAIEKSRLAAEVERLRELLEERYDFTNIVARSDRMKTVLEQVSRIAATDSTVFIHGESGTGKELIALAIHLASPRKERAYVAINCAALPEPLLESRLFGHEKGAFTGAIRSTKGLFTQAHEGTIFLDEIGDVTLSIQAKLLRVLQERSFYPVGSETLMEVNVRVIVATNKDLEEEVRQARFREDLYYRIHVIPVELPPLRERKEDILPLVDHFLKRFSEQMKKEVKALSPLAMQRLMLHEWPGNVRELENTIEYAVAMTQHEIISEEVILQPRPTFSQEPVRPLKEAKEAYERSYLIHLLDLSKGNVSRAAKLAGKYRADFYDLLRKHGLKTDDFKKSS
jgi:two-component system response regulator GlrR